MKRAIHFTFFNKKKIFFSWIVSYTLVLLIPIIISVAVYVQAYKIVENQITDYNQSILAKIKSEMDNKLHELNSFSIKISLDPNISYLVDMRGEEEIYSTFDGISKFFSFNKNITIYLPNNFIAKNYYIFFNNSNLVWTGSNLYNKELFMNANISNGRINSEQWDDFSHPVNSMYITDYYTKDGKKIVAIVQPLPLGTIKKKANIVYLLEEDIFADVSELSSLNKENLCVVNENGKILFRSGGLSSIDKIDLGDKLSNSSGIVERNIEGKDMIIVYTQSNVYPWKYISIIPKSVFGEQLTSLLKVIIFGITLCLLSGFFTIIIVLNKNYNPIREIINIIRRIYSDIFTKYNNEYNNEFQIIKDSIVDICEQNKSMIQKINQQNNTIRFNYIGRLLRGSVNFSDISDDMLNSMGIEFISDNFVIMICYIEGRNTWMDKYSELVKNGYSCFFENWILKRMHLALGDNYLIYQSEIGDFTACLINIADEERAVYKEKLLQELSNISVDIKNQIELDCFFAISGLNKTIKRIPIAYNQAMCAMEYKMLGSKKNIMFADDLEGAASNVYNYAYTLEDEQKLMNYIRVGDYDRALEIVNTVLDINQVKPDSDQPVVSINILRCIIYDLIGTFIRALNQDKMLEEIPLFDKNRIMEIMTGNKSAIEMRKELIAMLKYICDQVVKYREKSEGSYLIKKVDSLIEDYFNDENLNVTFISEKVGLNSKYLSAHYKRARGESIINAIHKRRIQEAKRLLMQEDTSIVKVANQIGFSNTNTFIRIFKKYEGITPGQFKELK